MQTMQDIYESYLGWVVTCVFLWAVRSLIGAGAFLFTGAAATLDSAAWIVGLLAGVLFVIAATTLAVRQTRLLFGISSPADLRRRGRITEDGFTFSVIKNAASLSFALTGMTLVVLELMARHLNLPPGFYVKLTLFVALMSFSLAYAVQSFGLVGRRHESA